MPQNVIQKDVKKNNKKKNGTTTGESLTHSDECTTNENIKLGSKGCYRDLSYNHVTKT